jgi:hypothetical protein
MTGAKLLQEDSPIVAGNVIERRGIFIPHNVTPGEYSLRLVVYHRADASPLVLADGRSEIELSKIAVTAAR